MPNLGSSTPYYGGGQVPNPSNVTQIYEEIPSFKANLGSLAVNSTEETAYIAISESGRGNGTVWAEILTTASPEVFPITPYVVGPIGRAGYQTIQAAMSAANDAGGGVVYLQPGTYTENLMWPLGVSLVCIEPSSFASEVNIIGQHTIVPGNSSFRQFGAAQINFQGLSSIFTGSITGIVSSTMKDCIFTITGPTGFVYQLPSIQTDVRSVFELSNVTVSGGAFSLPGGTINVFESILGFSNQNISIVGGTYTFQNSSIGDSVLINGSSNLSAVNCIFSNSVSLSGSSSAAAVFLQCTFSSDSAPSLNFNGNSSAEITQCSLSSSATNAIQGTSSGMLFINEVVFPLSSGINPALNITWADALVGGSLVATNSGPTFVGGTAYTNATTVATANPIALPDHWITIYEGATPFYMPVWAAVP